MLNKLDNFTELRKLKGCPKDGDAVSMVSCWAILFSTIFYISILFFFNIHISTVINTTKFWFLILNTLILIIAADFGAFFSSTNNNEQDLYEDYARKTHARNVPSFENHYMENNTRIETPDTPEEHIKDVVVAEKIVSKGVNLDVTNKNEPTKKKPWEEKVEKIQEEEKAPKFDRTNYLVKGVIVVGDEEREIVLRRSKSEKHPQEAEDTEFSAMSVEELNRRVEDFIQKFNQEIRLQATKTNRYAKKL